MKFSHIVASCVIIAAKEDTQILGGFILMEINDLIGQIVVICS